MGKNGRGGPKSRKPGGHVRPKGLPNSSETAPENLTKGKKKTREKEKGEKQSTARKGGKILKRDERPKTKWNQTRKEGEG